MPTISAGAVWSGPDLAGAGEWGKDFEAAALAQKLASRRTSLEEADQLIDAFANATQDKAQRLTRVFAGVLGADQHRARSRPARHRALCPRPAPPRRPGSGRERPDSAVKDSPGAVTTRTAARSKASSAWDRRIFEERSQALTYVCEAPVLLEQRLFEIARRIQARLP